MRIKLIIPLFLLSLVLLYFQNFYLAQKASASSFTSNQGITEVRMRVLPCEKVKDEKGREKCKKKGENPDYQKSIPVVFTGSSGENELLAAINNFLNNLFNR